MRYTNMSKTRIQIVQEQESNKLNEEQKCALALQHSQKTNGGYCGTGGGVGDDGEGHWEKDAAGKRTWVEAVMGGGAEKKGISSDQAGPRRKKMKPNGNSIKRPGGPARNLCEHQRQRCRCKTCGGSSICVHQRRRSQCKDCVGSNICKHQRQKSQCQDCGGSSICEHQRIRSRCKDCGGNSICEHQRVRSRCKNCISTKKAKGDTAVNTVPAISCWVHVQNTVAEDNPAPEKRRVKRVASLLTLLPLNPFAL